MQGGVDKLILRNAARGLVTHLVNSQSGLSHFSTEIPTVGGRTHIGVLDLKDGFRLIDEPELTLTGTGFDHE
ncbi:MAG: hypothetical protein DRQ97_08780 [Gammaproteobacteria bacterium]|nr:MAG: hypothetical protein DRQ97_08780 [Gammaproteobacteria bacterium]